MTVWITLLLLLSGCTSLQPSRYENYSRDGENRVVAQGEAANNAAWVHSSAARLGHPSGSAAAVGTPAASPQSDVLAESSRRLYEDAVRTASSAASRAIDQSIWAALR